MPLGVTQKPKEKKKNKKKWGVQSFFRKGAVKTRQCPRALQPKHENSEGKAGGEGLLGQCSLCHYPRYIGVGDAGTPINMLVPALQFVLVKPWWSVSLVLCASGCVRPAWVRAGAAGL